MRLVHKTASPAATRISARPRIALGVAVGVAAALLLTVVLSVDLLPRVYEVHEGDVAATTIKACCKQTYLSQIRTNQARDTAASLVPPVVELDRDRIVQQTRGLADLLQAINTVRGDPSRRNPADRAPIIAQLTTPPLSQASALQLASADDFKWSTLSNESQRLLQDVLKDRIPDDQVDEIKANVSLRASPFLADADRAVVVELVQRFVSSNLALNQYATAGAKQDRREAIAPVEQAFERGQAVVRDGQVVGPFEIEALDALGLRNHELDWRQVAASALLAFSLIGVLAAFIWHFDRPLLYRDRRMILLAGLIIVAPLPPPLVIPGRPPLAHIFPP